MNLFVVGISSQRSADPDKPKAAISTLIDQLPFFPDGHPRTWHSASGIASAAWVCHEPAKTGGVDYVHCSEYGFALFSGRPVLWTSDQHADGRKPLDPAFFLNATDDELLALDGRFTAAKYDESSQTLKVVTDPLGAYPLFETQRHDTRWISNNAEVLRELRGTYAMSATPLADLLGGGWSLSGSPLWEGVERLPGAGVHQFTSAGRSSLRRSFSDAAVVEMLGADFQPSRAADLLVENVRALSDWPGRSCVVPVTAGRDSRLVLGAALRSGIPLQTITRGNPDDPDVKLGRQLAEVAGAPHAIDPAPVDARALDWMHAARLITLMSSGTASLADAAGYPSSPIEGPLAIFHSGQGGEIARGFYGSGAGLSRDALLDKLFREFSGQRLGRREILSPTGTSLIQQELALWVDQQLDLGTGPADIPDMFYLKIRMGTWAGPGHGCREFVRDVTSPLWSYRLLPDALGLPASDRLRELFHYKVLQELSPELVSVPFERGNGWPATQSRLGARLAPTHRLLRHIRPEAERRLASLRPRRLKPSLGKQAESSLAKSLTSIREVVLSQPQHPAWEILDNSRVAQLLNSEPAALDITSSMYVWRLATAFTACPTH